MSSASGVGIAEHSTGPSFRCIPRVTAMEGRNVAHMGQTGRIVVYRSSIESPNGYVSAVWGKARARATFFAHHLAHHRHDEDVAQTPLPMGKSAKLHKRPKNLKKASTGSGAAAPLGGAQAQAQSAKKKAGLKQKSAAGKGASAASGGHVLGGVDYVGLMMGSRKQAREEAAKLPRDA
ncbi:hypothetical protein B0H17DRAFT_1236490 [Mycena rosella]|uniref:Uncharacterized protein n=1 Tax=Mycena rosella TaxID=1033263 RepID=A0AAD7D422_MYCRO|nr:hypothetical protein B0H17DRAFT_1236490 [Mycena rosella]